jgi:hypothetical protein
VCVHVHVRVFVAASAHQGSDIGNMIATQPSVSKHRIAGTTTSIWKHKFLFVLYCCDCAGPWEKPRPVLTAGQSSSETEVVPVPPG